MSGTSHCSDEPASGHRVSGLLKRCLSEPLLHFLLIGVALFAAYGALNPGDGGAKDSRRIGLTPDDLAQVQLAWMAQWRRPPTPEEMRNLLDAKVREEILSREAIALGLDKSDTIVKRRMAQKMEFVMEDLSALREPAGDELRRWFGASAQRFALPSLVSFRHLYFSPDLRGARAREDAEEALRKLAGKPEGWADLEGLSDPFPFQDFYNERSPDQVAGIFGTGFAQALPQLKEGGWQGPLQSGLGWHLVWIETTAPGRVPPFEEIEATVKSAWMDEQRGEAKRKMFEIMRARYEVVLPQAAAGSDGAFGVATVPAP